MSNKHQNLEPLKRGNQSTIESVFVTKDFFVRWGWSGLTASCSFYRSSCTEWSQSWTRGVRPEPSASARWCGRWSRRRTGSDTCSSSASARRGQSHSARRSRPSSRRWGRGTGPEHSRGQSYCLRAGRTGKRNTKRKIKLLLNILGINFTKNLLNFTIIQQKEGYDPQFPKDFIPTHRANKSYAAFFHFSLRLVLFWGLCSRKESHHTLKSSPPGELNKPAAFQWPSYIFHLLLFSCSSCLTWVSCTSIILLLFLAQNFKDPIIYSFAIKKVHLAVKLILLKFHSNLSSGCRIFF